MESMILFISILFLWCIICLILFLKIWIMTNDVSKIKDLLNQILTTTNKDIRKEPSIEDILENAKKNLLMWAGNINTILATK